MEGGGGFGYMNLHNYPLPYPPLTAIDRFLWGQKENFLVPENGVLDLSSYSNSYVNSGFNGGWNLYTSGNDFETSFDDGVLLDGDHYMNPNLGLSNINSESNLLVDHQQSFKQVEMKLKGGYSSNLIKGQWTDEEDRKLVKLVKQHGVRKWAQIAEKMAGRAGKQCRERWNNHLRPNIKKDSWSEEEERMLIEAHMKIGNKWAEIAKKIPGRTENSIKNHWNATKRRQNTRKKTKKNQQYDQPSLLQDYIKANISKAKTSENTPTPANSTISDDDLISNIINTQITNLPLEEEYYSSQPLITNTYDEELKFLMTVFGNKPNEVSPTTEPKNAEFGQKVNEELPNNNYMYSDMYMSYLLEGGSNDYGASDQDFRSNGDKMEVEMNNEGGRNEMDLVEMVSSSSQFY